jgi:hypothetical protein
MTKNQNKKTPCHNCLVFPSCNVKFQAKPFDSIWEFIKEYDCIILNEFFSNASQDEVNDARCLFKLGPIR